MVNKANSTPSARTADGERRSASRRRRRCRRTRDRRFRETPPRSRRNGRCATARARRARWRSSRPATSTTTSRASGTTSSRCSSTTRFRYALASRTKRAAACRSSSSAISSRVEKLKDINMPPLARAGARGLRDPDAGAVVHADVQAGAAAAVSRRSRRAARSRDAMFDPFEYFVLRDKDGLLKKDSSGRSARSAITFRATRGCRTSGRRRARCSSGCRTRRSIRSSAARATTARGA